MLMDVITRCADPLGLTRADVDFTCLGSCDYITGQAFLAQPNPTPSVRGRPNATCSRWTAWAPTRRGSGSRRATSTSPSSSSAPVHRRPVADLPDGDGPVLPRTPRCRPADARRCRPAVIAAGLADERSRSRGSPCGPGAPKATAGKTTHPPGEEACASRSAATTCRRSPTAPPPWCWPGADRARNSSNGPPTSPDSTTGPSATTRHSERSTTRRRSASPGRRRAGSGLRRARGTPGGVHP